MDAASNNSTLIVSLSSILKKEKNITWDHEKMHINCLDHVINLAIQKFLQSIKVVKSKDKEEDGEVEVVESETEPLAGTLTKVRGLAEVSTPPGLHCAYAKACLHITF